MLKIILCLTFITMIAVAQGGFVYDKRLLNATRLGRDFSGSKRYGTFFYSGTCPDNYGPLVGVTIALASSNANCFTDGSIADAPTIGYICIPGSPSEIHFGNPGTQGFVIGGPNFVGTGIEENGFHWGSIGAPTTTGGSASVSCTDSCTSTWCGGPCTASCPAQSQTSTGESCTENYGNGGTVFFVPNGFAPTNCGSLGQCCNGYTFPPARGCGRDSFTMFGDIDLNSGLPFRNNDWELGSAFTVSTSGLINQISFFNPPGNQVGYTGFIGKIWDSAQNLIFSASFPPATANDWQFLPVNPPLCIQAGQTYTVSVNFQDNQNYHFIPSIPSPRNYGPITFLGESETVGGGSFPAFTNFQYLVSLENICFTPAVCRRNPVENSKPKDSSSNSASHGQSQSAGAGAGNAFQQKKK